MLRDGFLMSPSRVTKSPTAALLGGDEALICGQYRPINLTHHHQPSNLTVLGQLLTVYLTYLFDGRVDLGSKILIFVMVLAMTCDAQETALFFGQCCACHDTDDDNSFSCSSCLRLNALLNVSRCVCKAFIHVLR
jgi:hypothetical protein